LEPEVRHVSLQSFGRSIAIPQLEAPLDVIEGCTPITSDVAFESLSENRVKLLDVLLKTNYVAIKSEHIVNSFVLEAFDVDSFILCQFYQIACLVVFWYKVVIQVVETQVESVYSHGLLELLHSNHVDFSKSMTSLK